MNTTVSASLIEHFSKLEDPRVDRNKKHELIDVIGPRAKIYARAERRKSLLLVSRHRSTPIASNR